MANNTKEIKNKIESVENTKQMTKAMEMVAAAKMRKATEATENARIYAKLAQELLDHLSHIEEPGFDLLKLRPVEDVLVIMMTSDRGLCGSYNSKVFNLTKDIVEDKELIARHRVQYREDVPEPNGMPNIHVAAVGKKSAEFAKKHDYELPVVFDDMPEKPTFEDVLPLSKIALDGYKNKKYDRIVVAYTHFNNTLSQDVKMKQVLPISPKDLASILEKKNGNGSEVDELEKQEDFPIERYIFEPNVEEIMETVLPRLVEIEIFQAMLNASASEHSSRMIAMKNASENAEEMVEDLTLSYNKARQAAITREIAEISSGAEALSE